MAALPGLAHAAHREDPTGFGSAWRQGLSYAVIASLPLLVLLTVFSGPTASILANGQLRHAALIGPLAICLAVVAVAQLVGGISDLGCQALYARLEDRICQPRCAGSSMPRAVGGDAPHGRSPQRHIAGWIRRTPALHPAQAPAPPLDSPTEPTCG
jgi:hypothetical protein